MIELFVENQAVDISTGFSTLITYAIDDVKDFGAKNTTFSKTMILPGTKRNNRIFGNVFQINRSTQYNPGQPNTGYNYNAAVSAKAIILADNIQVFKGVLRLLEIVIDGHVEYEVAVFGELGGLIYDLGNKKLEELNFSAYDQDYSLANIIGSWDNAPGTGVYFPLIDYGTYSNDKHNWQYRTFRPALYAAEYLAKIFSGSRYTYDAPLFGTDRFKSCIVPHNAKRLTRLSSTYLNVSNTDTSIYHETDPAEFFPFYNVFSTLGSFTNGGSYLEYGGATPITGDLRFRFAAHYDKNWANPINLQLYTVNGASSTTYFAAIYDDGVPNNSGDIVVDVTIPAVTINPGDRLTIYINTGYPGNPGDALTLTITDTLVTLMGAVPDLVQINLDEPIVINDTIPRNILQKDFFSSIVKLFNCYVYEDRDVPNLLKITPYPDFYISDPAEADDWTNKLDRSRPQRIKPLSELNARYYEFKHKNDSDFYNDQYRKRYNENYGDRIYDSQFQFAEESQSVEIIFSGTPLVGYPGEDKVYSTILKSSAGVEETIDSNVRLLQTLKVIDVTGWQMYDDATPIGSTLTVYGYAGHLNDPDAPTNDLNFGAPKELFFILATGGLSANQFNLYYASYMAEITDADSKLLTAYFRLTRRDIYELNFARYKWIDGGKFKINRIVDYNATEEDTCQVELLKVLNTIY